MKTTIAIGMLLLSGCQQAASTVFHYTPQERSYKSETNYSDMCYERELAPGTKEHAECVRKYEVRFLLGDLRLYR